MVEMTNIDIQKTLCPHDIERLRSLASRLLQSLNEIRPPMTHVELLSFKNDFKTIQNLLPQDNEILKKTMQQLVDKFEDMFNNTRFIGEINFDVGIIPINRINDILHQLRPFLQTCVEIFNNPQTQLKNEIKSINSKLDKQIKNSSEQIRILDEQNRKLDEQNTKLREEKETADRYNLIYDLVAKAEKIYSKRKGIDQCITFNDGMYGKEIYKAEELKKDFLLPEKNAVVASHKLLEMVDDVKNERLEYGHSSKNIQKSTSLKDALVIFQGLGFSQEKVDVFMLLIKSTIDAMNDYNKKTNRNCDILDDTAMAQKFIDFRFYN